MKAFIILGAISLISSSAFAHDKVLGGNSELDGSVLLDHGTAPASNTIPRNHDHGDDTAKNFVKHDHDQRIADTVTGNADLNTIPHTHGDDSVKDFTPHSH